jgi:hypothetical protein
MNTHRILLASFLMAAPACWAQPGPSGDHRPPAPPAEAVAACKGKAVGSQASFTGRRGETVTGTCDKIGDVVAVRPAGGPPKGPQGGQPPSGNRPAP